MPDLRQEDDVTFREPQLQKHDLWIFVHGRWGPTQLDPYGSTDVFSESSVRSSRGSLFIEICVKPSRCQLHMWTAPCLHALPRDKVVVESPNSAMAAFLSHRQSWPPSSVPTMTNKSLAFVRPLPRLRGRRQFARYCTRLDAGLETKRRFNIRYPGGNVEYAEKILSLDAVLKFTVERQFGFVAKLSAR